MRSRFSTDIPYAPSQAITDLHWDEEIVRLGGEWTGDNWPMTWGDDGQIYTSYGDGNGFGPREQFLTLGLATVTGVPPYHTARDLPSNIDRPVGWGKEGVKSSGLLMVRGVLYLWVRNDIVEGNYRHARMAWSSDHGRTWTWADWHLSGTFGCPEFVQYGPNYAGARDGYVYVVSQAGDDAYRFDPEIVMARAPAEQVAHREAYTFFAGLDGRGQPLWSADLGDRRPVFSDPRGAQRIGLTYNQALKRYFLTTAHADGTRATHTPALGVFDAPEPWGPWTTAYDSDRWANGWMIHHKFPTPWMSEDGTTMWLAFSGQYRPGGIDYCLLARRAQLAIS
jgi:hypothetical protein